MKSTITEKEEVKTYYSYIRVSTKEQAKNGKNGLQRQMDAIDKYCTENKIDSEVTHFRDEGKSAFHGDHLKAGSGLYEFVQKLNAGELGSNPVLLVESLDRLSRQEIFDAQLQLMNYMALGLEIVTLIDGQVYTRSADSTKLTVAIIIALTKGVAAHEESQKRSVRQLDNMAKAMKKARKDKTPGTLGCYPAWIRPVKDKKGKTTKLVVIPERAKIIKRICKLVSEGTSKSAVAKLLNEEEVPTFGRGKKVGKKWHVSYIQQICVNPALIGEYHPKKENRKQYIENTSAIKRYYPRVIKNSVFHTISTSKTRYAKVTDPSDRVGTLGLNVFYNGTKMRFRAKGKDKRYKNAEFKAYYTAHTVKNELLKSIIYSELELQVFDAIQQFTSNKQNEKYALFKMVKGEIAVKSAEVQLLESKHDNLVYFVESAEIEDSTRISKRIDDLEKEIKVATKELDQLIKSSERKSYAETTVNKLLLEIKEKEFSRNFLKEISAKIIDKIVLEDDRLLIYLNDGSLINKTK